MGQHRHRAARPGLRGSTQAPEPPVFPNRNGTPMTRSGVRDRLDRAVATANTPARPSRGRNISPAHPSALDGRPPPRVGHRPGRHRLVARPLQPGRHPPIPRSRPRHQRSHPRTPERPEPKAYPIPARRPAPRLPRGPVIMCSPAASQSTLTPTRERPTAHNRELSRIGVMRSSP